ncbi:MAG: helix-turn-helix transcriptional regulator [Pseudonocardiaceae bacterium]
MRLSDMKPAEQLIAERRADPSFQERWDRAAYARTVANRLIQYRAEHNLTQEQLAAVLGVKQPHVWRLESGEYPPSIPTLLRLAQTLGMEFHLDITPTSVAISA